MNIAKLKVGDKVCYQPSHYPADKWENGMIKEIPEHAEHSVRVVYNCNGNWENFTDYTGALTNLRDLSLGWKHDTELNNKTMITLEYFNGTEWVKAGTWATEEMAWISLGGDNYNYRTVDENGKVLTDKSK